MGERIARWVRNGCDSGGRREFSGFAALLNAGADGPSVRWHLAMGTCDM